MAVSMKPKVLAIIIFMLYGSMAVGLYFIIEKIAQILSEI